MSWLEFWWFVAICIGGGLVLAVAMDWGYRKFEDWPPDQTEEEFWAMVEESMRLT